MPHLAGLVHARVGLAFSFERPSGRCGDDRVELFPLLQRCENGGCPILAGLVHARVGLAFSLEPLLRPLRRLSCRTLPAVAVL